ncbi:hypothetical protein RSAG8_13553, partial [Rhizoctonia solani AG-8 WAC10335]
MHAHATWSHPGISLKSSADKRVWKLTPCSQRHATSGVVPEACCPSTWTNPRRRYGSSWTDAPVSRLEGMHVNTHLRSIIFVPYSIQTAKPQKRMAFDVIHHSPSSQASKWWSTISTCLSKHTNAPLTFSTRKLAAVDNWPPFSVRILLQRRVIWSPEAQYRRLELLP